MGAAIRRVVDAYHNLAGQQSLDSQVPLEDVRILRFGRPQVICIRIAPFCQLAVLHSLRAGQAAGKRISKARGARIKVVLREKHRCAFAERSSGILEVRGHAHAVIHARSSANDGIGIQLIGKTEPGSDVVAIHRNASHLAAGEQSNPVQCFASQSQGGCLSAAGQVDGHAAGAGEIAELDPVVALRIGRAPFIAQAQIKRELRVHLPIVLKVESRFF